MRIQSGKVFIASIAALLSLASWGLASNHHSLNGTWTLLPTRSNLRMTSLGSVGRPLQAVSPRMGKTLRRQQKRRLQPLSRPRPTDAPAAGRRPPMRQAWRPSLGTPSAPKPRQRPPRARHKPGRRTLRRWPLGSSCFPPVHRQSILHIARLYRAARSLQLPIRRLRLAG